MKTWNCTVELLEARTYQVIAAIDMQLTTKLQIFDGLIISVRPGLLMR